MCYTYAGESQELIHKLILCRLEETKLRVAQIEAYSSLP